MGKPVRVRLPARAMAIPGKDARAADIGTETGEPRSSREDEIMAGKEYRGLGACIAARWRALGAGVIGITLGALCMALQCPVNVPGPVTGTTISFANDIQPIFNDLCIGCHVTGGFADQSGIALRLVAGQSFDLLVNQKSVQDTSLTLVIPGDSANSLLFQKTSQDTPPVGATMPLVGRRLTSTELALVRDWIDQGALDN